jgi:hypothetical protein
MKRIVICIALVIGISSFASSLEETWLSLGTGFGNYFENGTDLTHMYAGSLGINFGEDIGIKKPCGKLGVLKTSP